MTECQESDILQGITGKFGKHLSWGIGRPFVKVCLLGRKNSRSTACVRFFFCSAEFDETHIFPSVKSKQEGSARIRRANGGLRRRQRRNVLCCALDNGAELKRAEPCDRAKGEPLMCHINPPPLSLASARTMMSSATVKSRN